MIATSTGLPATAGPWTCPFCPLLCDSFGVAAPAAEAPLELIGSDCPRARAALQHFGAAEPAPMAQVDGRDCSFDDAIASAADLLLESRQPLFGGLGTDVAGGRALYALAADTGAICDAAHGAALFEGVRGLQDRGGFTTTLAEVRARADLIVCLGGVPSDHYPEFFRRTGSGAGSVNAPQVVVVGGDADEASRASLAAQFGDRLRWLALDGDLFDAVSALAAAVAGRERPADAGLAALADALKAARYAVLVYETARLSAHGALLIEIVQRIVSTLNRGTRAAALPLGGGDGAGTVNQVFTWLSGLPLRSRATPAGLEHEPACFDARRLIERGAVDSLLWISSFGPLPAPPNAGLPTIVLGHPALAGAAPGGRSVFIAVSTPGIGSGGHLFRTDSSVLLPLHAARPDLLPTVASVLQRLRAALEARRGPADIAA